MSLTMTSYGKEVPTSISSNIKIPFTEVRSTRSAKDMVRELSSMMQAVSMRVIGSKTSEEAEVLSCLAMVTLTKVSITRGEFL